MKAFHDYLPETDAALDVADVVALERRLDESGTPLSTLMQRAGEALAQAVLAITPQDRAHAPRVLVLCGSGNNGGDGWVCAARLAAAGCKVAVACTRAPEDVTAAPAAEKAREAAADLAKAGAEVVQASDKEACDQAARDADVIVDALLGTGFSGESVSGDAGTLCALATSARDAILVSADVPSGVNAQTGEFARGALRADYTVTMLKVKAGMVSQGRPRPWCGRLLVAPLEG